MISLDLTQLFSNNAVSLLSAPISETATELSVMPGHGALYPQPSGDGSDYFLITLEDQSASVREIIKVTARVGDTFFFNPSDRGLEGTIPRSWSASLGNDTLVDHRITAETLTRATLLPKSVPASGADVFDAEFTTVHTPNSVVLTFAHNFVSNTVRLFVGGLRQKRNIDFTESGINEITILSEITEQEISDGLNIVVDYTKAT